MSTLFFAPAGRGRSFILNTSYLIQAEEGRPAAPNAELRRASDGAWAPLDGTTGLPEGMGRQGSFKENAVPSACRTPLRAERCIDFGGAAAGGAAADGATAGGSKPSATGKPEVASAFGYRAVHVQRFGWKRSSLVSHPNSPLLVR